MHGYVDCMLFETSKYLLFRDLHRNFNSLLKLKRKVFVSRSLYSEVRHVATRSLSIYYGIPSTHARCETSPTDSVLNKDVFAIGALMRIFAHGWLELWLPDSCSVENMHRILSLAYFQSLFPERRALPRFNLHDKGHSERSTLVNDLSPPKYNNLPRKHPFQFIPHPSRNPFWPNLLNCSHRNSNHSCSLNPNFLGIFLPSFNPRLHFLVRKSSSDKQASRPWQQSPCKNSKIRRTVGFLVENRGDRKALRQK